MGAAGSLRLCWPPTALVVVSYIHTPGKGTGRSSGGDGEEGKPLGEDLDSQVVSGAGCLRRRRSPSAALHRAAGGEGDRKAAELSARGAGDAELESVGRGEAIAPGISPSAPLLEHHHPFRCCRGGGSPEPGSLQGQLKMPQYFVILSPPVLCRFRRMSPRIDRRRHFSGARGRQSQLSQCDPQQAGLSECHHHLHGSSRPEFSPHASLMLSFPLHHQPFYSQLMQPSILLARVCFRRVG